MKNNNDEFELNFDDDVIDMTATDSQAGGNGSQSQNNDIYGVYQGSDRYESRAEAIAAKRVARYERDEKKYAIVNVLYYIALWSGVGYLAFFVVTGNHDFTLFTSMSGFFGLFFEVVIIVDAFMMHSRYKKVSLIITGVAFPFLYPFFRSSARSESKNLATLWFVAYILVAVLFFKNSIVPMALDVKIHDTYESKYETTMNKFKEYKYDGKTTTERVLGVWFSECSLSVKKEDSDNLYVQVSGQTATEIQGVVKPSPDIKPNTVYELKVKKADGSYEIISLKINNSSYDKYKVVLWEYWFSQIR